MKTNVDNNYKFGQNIKRKKVTANNKNQGVIKNVQKLEQSIPVKEIAANNFFIFCEFFPEGKPLYSVHFV